MPALDAGIHVLLYGISAIKTWMAGLLKFKGGPGHDEKGKLDPGTSLN